MIRSVIIFALVFFLLLFFGVPAKIAAGIGSAVFVISIPFSLIFGWAERSERRAEERNESLREIARKEHKRLPVPPMGGSGTRPVKRVYKDDRAIIIDNRQVNIYNGIEPREN